MDSGFTIISSAYLYCAFLSKDTWGLNILKKRKERGKNGRKEERNEGKKEGRNGAPKERRN